MKAIPLAPVVPVLYVGYNAVKSHGLSPTTLADLAYHTTGYDPSTGMYNIDGAKGFWFGEIAGIVVHKVANKTGLNKYVRKATLGYFQL